MSHRNKELLRLLLSFVVGGFLAYAILNHLHISDRSVERVVYMVVLPLSLVGTYQAFRLLPFFKAGE
jgi:hypothetical protein